jgi:hypothetical protein
MNCIAFRSLMVLLSIIFVGIDIALIRVQGHLLDGQRPARPSLDQLDHALCGAGAGAVQKHLGQGVVSHVAT